jgi:hypothetical protein
MLLDDFTVDLVIISWWTQKKRSLGAWSVFLPLHTYLASGCLECFFSLSSHIWQGLKDFLPLSKPKTGVRRRNNNSFGIQEGAVTTSGEYLERGVYQGLCVVHKAQRKVCLNQLCPGKEIIK